MPKLTVSKLVVKLMNWTDKKAFNKHNVPEFTKFFAENPKFSDMLSTLTGKTAVDNWDMQERHVVRTTEDQETFMAVKLKASPKLVKQANTFLHLVESMDKYYAALIYYGYL